MTILNIRKYPDPILRKKAKRISTVTDEILRLVSDMIETLEEAGGVGLAAPQVGFSIQLSVIKPLKENPAVVLLNPRIKSVKGRLIMEEGCLSIPGVTLKVKRYNEIVLEAMNIKGERVKLNAGELLSRIIQHELDHLNGVLILDRVNLLKRIKTIGSFRFKAIA
ncbi:MAG: peptide deformylase [Candidatus Omnitrophica bacterium]|nr:peptide deformylase [Candidatus Omnitrophota bacterium]